MPAQAPASKARPLLVVAPAPRERGALFGALEARGDFRVIYAATVSEALQILGDRPVVLVIAAPELPASTVTDLLASTDRLRPAIPVLIIRDRQAPVPSDWERHGVGVLRRPLLPEALDRSVDVVLGLARRRN